jgi:hypothetical protein
MYIVDDRDLRKWVDDTLEEVRAHSTPSTQDRCPHCGFMIRYPLVVRHSDLVFFESIMRSAFTVMERHGITANLLADIRAECLIAIAKKRMSETDKKLIDLLHIDFFKDVRPNID